MTRTIAVANQKGGTGKTTTALNLTAGLARSGFRVLLIDVDPQANATAVFLGVPAAAGPRQANLATAYEVILNQSSAADALRRVALDDGTELDILPSHLDLAAAELELVNAFERERRLRHALQPIQASYDFIIIDCPPSLGLLTVNALMASSEVIIPVDPGLFPIIGLNLLNNTIAMVKQANPSLTICGVVPTLIDRTALSRDTLGELEQNYGKRLLPPIPRRVAIGEAHAAGQDIFGYEGTGDSSKAYAALVKEVVKRG